MSFLSAPVAKVSRGWWMIWDIQELATASSKSDWGCTASNVSFILFLILRELRRYNLLCHFLLLFSPLVCLKIEQSVNLLIFGLRTI
jgi:hypothetical protein